MWALLPVKDLQAGKSRLANALPEYARQSLMAALLADLLGNLQQSQGVAGILVVTRCPIAASIARNQGAEVLSSDQDTGLNEAVAEGIAELGRRGVSGALVMHADLPMATAADVDALLDQHRASGAAVSLVPDNRLDGTNAMCLTLPSSMQFAYGKNSYPLHQAFARGAGIPCTTLHNEHIGCDIDLWDDFQPLFSLANHTRQRRHLAHWLEQYGELFEWPQAANL